jgi:Carboxypeptidase regulatory-like domain
MNFSKITNRVKFFCLITLALFAIFSINAVDAQTENTSPKPKVGTAVRFDVSPPLRTMKIKLDSEDKDEKEAEDDRGLAGPVGDTNHDPDPVVQNWFGDGVFSPKAFIPPVGVNFNGMTGSTSPPDTNGDIGTNHYVQMVNTRFQVFSRTGTSLFGPASINTLWAGFGGACQTENSGDPVVLYDQLADRWLLTQFTSAGPTFFNCVALSQTSDPTGSYYRWAFTTGTNFPDYPKYGIWSDGYYISTREFAGTPFAGVGAYALNRDQMLVGNPTPQVVSFVFPPGAAAYRTGDGLLVADLDGTTLPPAGSPAYFLGSMDSGGPYTAPADALNLFKFQVNWTTPASSTFTFANQINVADFDSIFPCTPSARACISQPGTTNKIDILSYRQRPLFRLAYRNFGTHESLVTNQSVEATTGLAGIRWWEIRSPNNNPTIFQEGTYAPDAVNRWMGSLAMDRLGNMGLGFSVSDATSIFPGIRYTGRLATDTTGTMPQGEGTFVAGAGSQTGGGNRWGDYSAMTVDPTDDCTFWFTAQYFTVTSAATWTTRISSFKFPNCSNVVAQPFSVSGRVTRSGGTGFANLNLTIQSTAGGEIKYARTNSLGYYRFSGILSGQNYIVSVIGKKYTFTPQAVFVNNADLTSINFSPTNLVAGLNKKR